MLGPHSFSSSRNGAIQGTCTEDNPASGRDLCRQKGPEPKDLSEKLLRSATRRKFIGCSRFYRRRWKTCCDRILNWLLNSDARKVGLAYNLVQKFEFDRVEYSYDRDSDVLD